MSTSIENKDRFAATQEFIDYPDGQTVLVLDPEGNDRSVSLKAFSPTAAAICVQRYGPNGKKEILLIQRRNEPGRKLWSLPGGKRLYPEENIFAPTLEGQVEITALRETREETGLRLAPKDLGGIILGFYYPESGHRVVAFDAFLPADDKRWTTIVQAGEDIIDVRWVPEDEIPRLALTPLYQEVLFKFAITEQ